MILGVIPARGGSKGIPRKNLRPIAGKPLVVWSIEAARRARRLDRFVVSTEDREIAEVSQRAGAEVLWRPAELASDGATTAAVLKHIVLQEKPDHLVLLQPTSPVRIGGLIDRAIERFFASGADTLATGFTTYQYEWGTMDNVPRQQMKGWFYDDGNVYVHKAAHLGEGRWFGARREPLVIEDHYNYEIDNETQFWAVEAIMLHLIERHGSLD
ncbi:MAG: acylneuraminate cytidylyltransferase family protein [Elusimicrobia bacterium]|nr:acylneuraminate cytidylyltransferase family protein [Elusimicrobiota bacterium]